MKVGILTMQYRKNYGGVLQAYALYKVIESLGYDVEHIDFRYSSVDNVHFVTRIVNGFIRVVKLFRIKNKSRENKVRRDLPNEHIKVFSDFKKKYIKYSRPVYNDTIHEIINDYDCIVVGSDQIWNNVEGRYLYFFFDFKQAYNGKKIAYAPCAVFTNTPWYNRCKLSKLLKKFDAIGVRDNTTVKLVNNVSDLNPKVVLDPTCLYDFKEFSESKPIIQDDYIFAYILGSELRGGHKNIIDKICRKYGNMKVVAAIIPDISLEVEKFANRIMYNASPSDWVNLIAHSKFVYTDSFHGCMFAMKYHKQFFAYYRDASRASRLRDIKYTYHIPNIYMSGDNYAINEIDYNMIDAILDKQKIDSYNFLKMNLENGTDRNN